MTTRDALLRLYHLAPPSLRDAAATLRGSRLRAIRYGPESERLVAEALDRERWPACRLREWREARTATMLHHAATRVPFYREQWTVRRRAGDRRAWDRLENWPVLPKAVVRAHPQAFLADGHARRQLVHDHTSGTTGASLDVWLTRHAVRAWYALHEARTRRWHGVSWDDPWGIIGGQLVAPVAQRHPPFWVWNGAGRQLYMSAYHIAPATAGAYVDAMRRRDLRCLVVYPSALHALARTMLEQELAPPATLRVVVTNAEALLPHQRAEIERAFACPVRETYGMSEAVAAASECEHGRLHLWPEAGVVEAAGVATPDGPLEHDTGLLCTGLLNDAMPLVRYAVGDRATIDAGRGSSCRCGRTLPVIEGIDGRVDDSLVTSDGRVIGRMDPVFKAGLPVREAQIIQERIDTIRVRFVPEPAFREANADELRGRIRERLGPVEIVMEPVERIPRSANGKFRAVVSQLSPDERARALGPRHDRPTGRAEPA